MPRKPKKLPTKSCQRCGEAFPRKRYNGRLEDASAYLRRLYCSLACANTRGNWGKSSTARHREAHKSVKPSCESCGIVLPTSKLHVHHMDGNYHNNCKSNLQTLCPKCHKHAHMAMA